MPRFNFAPVAVSRSLTRQWKIAELGVILTVASATEANRAYWSAYLAAGDALQGGQRLAGQLAENRAADVALFADHVLKGWAGVVDADDKPVPFSAATAREWLTALVGGDDDGATAWVFDELRKFCRDQGNFIAAAAGGLAKNS